MKEELAIIEGGAFGVRDTIRPILWFGVKMLSGGSLIVMEAGEALDFIEREQVADVSNLDGRACVIKSDGHRVTFVRLFK